MTPHTDEVLGTVGSSRRPKYNLMNEKGAIVQDRVEILLANSIETQGTPINKAVLDEFLAGSASGQVKQLSGGMWAIELTQEGFSYFNGAYIRFEVLNSDNTSTYLYIGLAGKYYPLETAMGENLGSTQFPAGTWLTAIFSETREAWILQTAL